MKSEKWVSVFAGAILAFGAAAGGVGCLVSGMELDAVDTTVTVLVCAVAAVLFAVALGCRMGLLALGIGVTAAAWLWLKGPLNESAELLVMQISKVYHSAYGTDVVRWSTQSLAQEEITAALGGLGSLIALTVAHSVIKRRWLGLSVLLIMLPLAACLVVTDAVPAGGYLFLSILVCALLLLTWQARQQSEHQGNVLLGLLCFPVALAVGLLFLLNPKEANAYQDGAEKLEQVVLELLGQADMQQHKPSGGFRPSADTQTDTVSTEGSPIVAARKVDLTTVGPKQHSKRVAMTVRAQQTETLYLRGCAYTLYDGSQWKTLNLESPEDTRFAAGDGEILTLNIQTPWVHNVLYTTYSPAEALTFTQGHLKNEESLKIYRIEYTQPQTYHAEWDAIAAESISLPEEYCQLSDETIAVAQTYLTRMLGEVPGGATAGQIWHSAGRIIDLVKNSATYSLQTPAMTAGNADFAMWFLENSDTGYCVHFATAATVLLRAAGIPARYVTGYLVEARAGELVEVTEDSAHAWVECYIGGVGWIALEPTPAAQTAAPVQPQQPSGPVQTEPAPSQQATETMPAPTGETKQPIHQQETPAVQLDWRWMLLPLAVLSLLVQWKLRIWLREKRRKWLDPNALTLSLWRETSRLSRLLRCPPDKALYMLAQKAKFSQHTMQEEELNQFRKAVVAQKKLLRKRHFGWQLLYCLVLAVY